MSDAQREPVKRPSERRYSRTRPKAVTMVDIARAAGVSQSTVSRVLSGSPTLVPITPETQERVHTAARALGYRPNPLARGLRGAPTMLLGVIIREITDPFFAYAIEAVSTDAAAHGYNVVLGHAHGRADEALALWAVLEARHCDGILIVGDMRDEPQLIEDLATARLPVVALWHGALVSGLPTVTVDNRAGILSVLGHLASLGHERIAFIGGRRIGGDNRQREDSFLAGLEALGLPLPDGYLLTTANDPEWGVEALGRLFDLPQPPTAIVCSTDLIASGVLHGAYERGLRVPLDLSVTGFDDLPMATFTIPSLTTVFNPIREVVSRGVSMILDLIGEHTPSGPPEHVVIEPRLIVRSSTGPVGTTGPSRPRTRRSSSPPA